MLTSKQIDQIVSRLAKKISDDYKDKCPTIIIVLKGAFIFAADLIRKLTIPCTVEFIRASSYQGTKSLGYVRFDSDDLSSIKITDKDVIAIDDIIDMGLTLDLLKTELLRLKPKSLKFCVLLNKYGHRRLQVIVDYIGHNFADGFVFGYGLDCNQEKRNLKDIFIVNKK